MEKIGRYTVEREIGEGGMATVFIARDPRFNRPVAIKVLPREYLHNPQFRIRFEREAQLIAKLEHKAIVPVYDFGEEEGQPYLVMRVMDGGDLVDHLEQGSMSPQQALPIISRIASALDRAHSASIIHRDLKPGNILFDSEGEAYLADFGIAKMVEGKTNLTGTNLIGTPAYMSPEQARGDTELDGRSDIYSLGAILFEMLTGMLPFNADTAIGQAIKHITEPIPALSIFRQDLPESFQEVINKAMAKDRDQRYQTGKEMAVAMQAAVDDTAAPRTAAASAGHPRTMLLDRMQMELPSVAPVPAATNQAPPPVKAAPLAQQMVPSPVAPIARQHAVPAIGHSNKAASSQDEKSGGLSRSVKIGIGMGALLIVFALFTILSTGDGGNEANEALTEEAIAAETTGDGEEEALVEEETEPVQLSLSEQVDDSAVLNIAGELALSAPDPGVDNPDIVPEIAERVEQADGVVDPFPELSLLPEVNVLGRFQFSPIETYTIIVTDTQTSMAPEEADPTLGPFYLLVGSPIPPDYVADSFFNEMLLELVLADAENGFIGQVESKFDHVFANGQFSLIADFIVRDELTNEISGAGRVALFDNGQNLAAVAGGAPIDRWNATESQLFDAVLETFVFLP